LPGLPQRRVVLAELFDDGLAGGVEVLGGGAQGGPEVAPCLGRVDPVDVDRRLAAGCGRMGLVEGLAGPHDDVERVEADACLWQCAAGGLTVGGAHVHRHCLDLWLPVGAEGVVELAQGCLAAAGRDPDDVTGGVVGDHGQELASLAVGDLVDADVVQAVQPRIVDMGVHQAPDDTVHGMPGGAHQRRDRGLGHPLRQPAGHVLEVGAVPGGRPGPGHPFGAYAATSPTVKSSHVGVQDHLPGTEVHVPPPAM